MQTLSTGISFSAHRHGELIFILFFFFFSGREQSVGVKIAVLLNDGASSAGEQPPWLVPRTQHQATMSKGLKE